MQATSRSKEPITYKQAMHELRKANKGARRLERRLIVAEGLLAMIVHEIQWNKIGQDNSDHAKLHRVFRIANCAFHSEFRKSNAIEKYEKHREKAHWVTMGAGSFRHPGKNQRKE